MYYSYIYSGFVLKILSYTTIHKICMVMLCYMINEDEYSGITWFDAL